jgi:predicted dehydrogenase
MRRIRAGVIGTGFIGPAHVEALRRLPNVEVAALADVDEPTARAKAAALGVESAYGDWRALLERPDVEVVHVCTPNHLHAGMAAAALQAGKHVVCEKPLATASAEAEGLARLAAERPRQAAAVHYNVRYYPLIRELKAMREEGFFGDLFAVHGSYLQDWLFYPTDWSWRLDPALSGPSRAVADIGSHWMDLVEHVSGLRITEVMADLATFHPVRKKPRRQGATFTGAALVPRDYEDFPVATEDYASILFRFDNGGRGSLTVSQASAGRRNRISLQMDGSRRAAAWDSDRPDEAWIGRRDGPNELLVKDPALAHPEARELMGFPGGHAEGFPDTSKRLFSEVYARIAALEDVGSARGGTAESGDGRGAPRYPTFADGLRTITLVERILESHAARAWITA